MEDNTIKTITSTPTKDFAHTTVKHSLISMGVSAFMSVGGGEGDLVHATASERKFAEAMSEFLMLGMETSALTIGIIALICLATNNMNALTTDYKSESGGAKNLGRTVGWALPVAAAAIGKII